VQVVYATGLHSDETRSFITLPTSDTQGPFFTFKFVTRAIRGSADFIPEIQDVVKEFELPIREEGWFALTIGSLAWDDVKKGLVPLDKAIADAQARSEADFSRAQATMESQG
jgi:hypothetical protein